MEDLAVLAVRGMHNETWSRELRFQSPKPLSGGRWGQVDCCNTHSRESRLIWLFPSQMIKLY